MRWLFVLAVVVGAVLADAASAQINRRDREDPELVVNSGGRMSACDHLIFTDDGKHLLAVGDDKVVFVWDFVDGKLQPAALPVLRWSIWREQRGAIYALALSPDKENIHVAIGGLGALNTTVAVLDRTTGAIVHTITPIIGDENFYAVWSMAFSPSGKQLAFGTGDGSVWVWDFKKHRRCGKHEPTRAGEKINTVRLVQFLDENTLLSVAQDGAAVKWDVGNAGVGGSDRILFEGLPTLHRVILSPDKKWLAAATYGPLVAVRSVDGKEQQDIPLAKGEFPRSIAFDPKNATRLAVAVGTLVEGSRFHVEADDQLRFYDLKSREPKMTTGPRHTYRAEFLAFHPKEDFLAVAGGDNHEVTLWNLDKRAEPASIMRGVGSCLWGVALSEDGKQFAFQDHHDAASPDPNKRGKGTWRVFDPFKRAWREAADFKPVEQFAEIDGWKIKPDANDPNVWYAVSPKGKEFELPRFPKQENLPRCYTFIKGDDKRPLRLAVGHYWGLSLYELTEKEVRRTRVFAGHQGEVMALAVSADRSWLVSASNDQTIAAWNIDDVFRSQPILGAKFAAENGKLFVKAVDVGSPAWEAGLIADDEVTQFRLAGEKAQGSPTEWLEQLKHPVPGLEHYFIVERAGEKEPIQMLTTARHRPLWRFFPTTDGEWALWMWRGSFYQCSTKGDSYLGWHVNNADMNRAPSFYRVEQFRRVLEQKDVINVLLKTRDVRLALKEANEDQKPLSFLERFGPPAVDLQMSTASVVGQNVEAKLLATAQSKNPDLTPARAELWVNDYRVREWKNLGDWNKKGDEYTLATAVPNNKLRVGKNVVTLQVYNRLGGRWDAAQQLECKRPPEKRRVYGLVIGVNDYSAAKVGPGVRGDSLNLSSARNDAEKMQELWAAQDTPEKGQPEPVLRLLDKNAKHAEILKALEDMADRVGPDDNFVLFLAGHGLFVEAPPAKGEAPLATFVFLCPDFDLAKKVETGISSEVLFGKLAAIPGNKFVIVDACQSGEAAASPVRVLVPGGQGPIVMAACDRNQKSYEDPKLKHGLFTYAILEALGDQFKQADVNGDKQLDATEIYDYTRRRMPGLLKQIGLKESEQVPVMSEGQTKIPLARLREK